MDTNYKEIDKEDTSEIKENLDCECPCHLHNMKEGHFCRCECWF